MKTNTKKKDTKTVKKQKDIGVKNYCMACLKIRKGIDDSTGNTDANCIPYTCRKTMRELNEFIFHMNIIRGIRKSGNMEGENIFDYRE